MEICKLNNPAESGGYNTPSFMTIFDSEACLLHFASLATLLLGVYTLDKEIKQILEQKRQNAVKAVNFTTVIAYWLV
jgi:hypothetical protein